jgi:hypothetical protein
LLRLTQIEAIANRTIDFIYTKMLIEKLAQAERNSPCYKYFIINECEKLFVRK